MSYYDPNARERDDRMITVYQFDNTTQIIANLTCNGQTPQIVIDLGGAPLELELVTDDLTAIDALITAFTEARQALIDHQAEHAWEHDTDHSGKPDEPLYVPDTWTGDTGEPS